MGRHEEASTDEDTAHDRTGPVGDEPFRLLAVLHRPGAKLGRERRQSLLVILRAHHRSRSLALRWQPRHGFVSIAREPQPLDVRSARRRVQRGRDFVVLVIRVLVGVPVVRVFVLEGVDLGQRQTGRTGADAHLVRRRAAHLAHIGQRRDVGVGISRRATIGGSAQTSEGRFGIVVVQIRVLAAGAERLQQPKEGEAAACRGHAERQPRTIGVVSQRLRAPLRIARIRSTLASSAPRSFLRGEALSEDRSRVVAERDER